MFTSNRQQAEDYARAHGHVVLYQITDRDTERMTYAVLPPAGVIDWLEDWEVMDEHRQVVNEVLEVAFGQQRT